MCKSDEPCSMSVREKRVSGGVKFLAEQVRCRSSICSASNNKPNLFCFSVKDESNHTIGVEFGSKIINLVNKMVKLQIWDTAGQERFRSVTRSYYRGAAGALLVYDITSRETYNALTTWLTDARMLASQNIVIILCGNKKDLDVDREVTFLEASRFAQENELMFLETSALTGENVEEAFVQCARKILNKIESGELDPERMGSGIQYGDAALRQLRSPRRGQPQGTQECSC
ncbi:ras-related protein Rab-4A isoform X1 [Pseudoliparis swirei]|uniref:ras-related protein Rab-4A isoform X1 n=1 Tax=Pseudoliparis swirei TaxID=2059687 RepID=UPI0024BDF14F|nr:ras-related protein Rab-4A isoform X1 [Pseudoliparis swirei]XP_056268242.1 ras-related protein Rab-4A isoform X1 [Pseudoliparis swirei]